MSADPSDFINRTATSNCCGASIIIPDICAECGEHCEAEEEETE